MDQKNDLIEKINKEHLCVLLINKKSEKVELIFEKFNNIFFNEFNSFLRLINKGNYNIKEVIKFLEGTSKFRKLSQDFNYCKDLSAAYQELNINVLFEIESFKKEINELNNELIERRISKETRDLKESELLNKFKDDLSTWINAYNLNIAYKQVQKNKDIIMFSHRLRGWSNPVFKFTKNFSVEAKTNFGYGYSSYFFILLNYKNLQITPFSDLVNYQFVNVSEIIRYSQTYPIENNYWFDALKYSQEACNLASSDEEAFINKYIIDECFEMICGLESLMQEEQFSFKKKENPSDSYVEKDIKGSDLVKFRGEKVSGSLGFISKILEFSNLISIKGFIDKIEKLNLQIQPILSNEIKELTDDLLILENEMKHIKPAYHLLQKENAVYNKKKNNVKAKLHSKTNINELNELVEEQFNTENPEYESFKKNFDEKTNEFNELNKNIFTKKNTKKAIVKYNTVIVSYFNSKKNETDG